jgi:hypothetical protein
VIVSAVISQTDNAADCRSTSKNRLRYMLIVCSTQICRLGSISMGQAINNDVVAVIDTWRGEGPVVGRSMPEPPELEAAREFEAARGSHCQYVGIPTWLAWPGAFCPFAARIFKLKSGGQPDDNRHAGNWNRRRWRHGLLWVVAEPLTIEQARKALQKVVPNFDQYLAESNREIIATRDLFRRVAPLTTKEWQPLCMRNSLSIS